MITTATARTTPSSINPEMKERPSERDAKRDGHKRRFADQVVERFAHLVEHRGARYGAAGFLGRNRGVAEDFDR